MSETASDSDSSGRFGSETLRAAMSLWQFWFWGALGALGAWYAYVHPKVIDGWFYEIVFGALAVGAVVLGLRRLVDSSPIGN